jgi:hypothetical protein
VLSIQQILTTFEYVTFSFLVSLTFKLHISSIATKVLLCNKNIITFKGTLPEYKQQQIKGISRFECKTVASQLLFHISYSSFAVNPQITFMTQTVKNHAC